VKLNIASGNYDRVQPLIDGSVRAEGVELAYQTLFPGELFRRMIRDGEFDGGELGLTYYLRTLELDPPPFIAIPVFPQRIFRHAALFVNADSGIESPAQLAGKRLGETFVFGTDAGTWVKGALRDDYGVRLESEKHYIGGIGKYEPAWDWLPNNPPRNARVEQLPPGQTLDAMLEAREIDALISPVMPASKKLRRLFRDYEAVERDYFRRTGIFPIMHTVVLRKKIHEKHPWLAKSLYDAFSAAKEQTLQRIRMADASMHSYTMMPWFGALRERNRELMGDDHWPYGLEPNRKTLETFLRHHEEQGLSRRRFKVEELFAL
jgi:4,5-dihydroxyphthalate decarboxylase